MSESVGSARLERMFTPLVSRCLDGDGHVQTLKGEVYAVYLPNGRLVGRVANEAVNIGHDDADWGDAGGPNSFRWTWIWALDGHIWKYADRCGSRAEAVRHLLAARASDADDANGMSMKGREFRYLPIPPGFDATRFDHVKRLLSSTERYLAKHPDMAGYRVWHIDAPNGRLYIARPAIPEGAR